MSGGGHGTEIRIENIMNMVKELKMENRQQFLNYINCPLKYQDYIDYLRKKNYI